eukprot:CAMPEP_0178947758 /NCGR_PEP_ID=MMETSP0789-20121207/5063_1 /TAXON_ID=3005 /ORGANISM="Rhizosolenia setigera, Strain CCMP 1694" /LENGTH=511 /DNA_ID=CAMNT_0020627985 /DNA_START=269 /DNA_END=1804 /DNA_ORIENTATION=-
MVRVSSFSMFGVTNFKLSSFFSTLQALLLLLLNPDLLLLEAAAADAATSSTNTLGCIDNFNGDYSQDLFPHKVQPLHSAYWDISYHNTYKIITNKKMDISYLFYQCGTEPPAGAENEHHVVLPVPLTGIAIDVYLEEIVQHVELLGKRDTIVAVDERYSTNSQCLQDMIDDGTVHMVDFSCSWSCGYYVEDFVSNNPEVLLVGSSQDKTMTNLMVSSYWWESGSKAEFEWNKVFAALYNLEHLGNQIAEEKSERYDCVVSNAEHHVAENSGEKPTIVWARWFYLYNYYTYDLTFGWYVQADCPGRSCQLTKDASAEFLELDGTGSLNCYGYPCLSDNDLLEAARDADHFIYTDDDFASVYNEKKYILDQFKSFQNQEVYQYVHGSWTYGGQTDEIEYDALLQDVATIVGTIDNHERAFFYNVFTEYVLDGTCSDVTAPLESQASSCTRIADSVDEDDGEDGDSSSSDSSGDSSSSDSSGDSSSNDEDCDCEEDEDGDEDGRLFRMLRDLLK